MSKQNKRTKFLQFTSIPFEMFIIIFAAYKLGAWLDEKYPNENALYTVICMLSGVMLSMGYILIRVRKLTQNKNEK